MSDVKMASPIMAVCDNKKLELGNKIFIAPTPSERKSTRNQQVKLKRDCQLREKGSIGIAHQLFLEPTLKRQKKKKQQQELAQINNTKKVSLSSGQKKDTELNGVPISIMKLKVVPPFVCASYSRRIRSTRKKKKVKKAINYITLRHLARCGGVKRISGSAIYDDKAHGEKSAIPPPFEANIDDKYTIPKPGQLISYLWHNRPSPMFDRKQIYRTGILCSTDGLIRFFNNDDNDGYARKDDVNRRNFYESKFYLNKRMFKEGKFRVRSDLVVGAVCYETEINLPCKILEIDTSSGAVLVKRLVIKDGAKNCLWISPDELVGNCRETARPKKGFDDFVSLEASTARRISCSALAAAQQEATCNSPYTTKKPYFSSQTSLEIPASWHSSDDNLLSEFQVGPREEDVRLQNISDLALNGSPSEARTISNVGVPSAFNNFNFIPAGGDIIDLTDDSSEHDYVNTELEQALPPSPPSHSAPHSSFSYEQLLDTNNRFDIHPRMAMSSSPMTSAGGLMLSSSAATAACNTASSSIYPSNLSAIQLELNLLRRHGMALEILMSTTDLPTMVASLQYVKSMQQRNVPLGPIACEVVTEAEMTSRALMEDALLRQMTLPIYSGGKGYNIRHAGMILCQMEPILGSNLGGLCTPSMDIMKLLSLGLTSLEALDILPYIQKFEDDILATTLSIKRQLAKIIL